MLDDVISLISQTQAQDAAGVIHDATERREVLCQVGEITRAEFYNAGRSGLNPEFMVSVHFTDYEGEELAEFRGQSYAIYRAYHIPGTDYMELYLSRKGGTNGKE